MTVGELHKLIADALESLSHAVGEGDHSAPITTAIDALRGETQETPPAETPTEPETPPAS